MIKVNTSPTLSPEWVQQKQAWLESGNLVRDGQSDYYILQADQWCDTTSMAAALVLGNNRNGWKYWKDQSGKTLDELLRK